LADSVFKHIIRQTTDVTNIRGRYKVSVVLLDGEVHRILHSRKFAANYGRAEWLSSDDNTTCLEFCDEDYHKVVICFVDGTREDISKEVAGARLDLKCTSKTGIKITSRCGVLTIETDKPISAVRAIYRKSEKENIQWLVDEHPHVLIAFLKWQLLTDIDAKASAVAYNVYVQLLDHLNKLEVVT